MQFQDLFARLNHRIEPGAHRIQRFLSNQFQQGALELPSVIVTGTNGKGSVSSLCEWIFRAHGLKTGLYTSPHLVEPSERIRISGKPISKDCERGILEELSKQPQMEDASFFEWMTLAAIHVFFEANVDLSIFEVGLGGLWDSTNACAPLASVITSVGWDHTEYLGNTLAKIATDKAHVGRRNRPLFYRIQDQEAKQAAHQVMERIGALPCDLSADQGRLYDSLHTKLAAQNHWFEWNQENFFTACHVSRTVLREFGQDLNEEKLASSASEFIWPGRFDVRQIDGKTFIFDVTHNASGAAYFQRQWAQSPYSSRSPTIIFGVLRDKDATGMMNVFSSLARQFIFTESGSERRVRAFDLARQFPHLHPRCAVIESLGEALCTARNLNQGEPILIIGSCTLVGDAMRLLEIDPFFRGKTSA